MKLEPFIAEDAAHKKEHYFCFEKRKQVQLKRNTSTLEARPLGKRNAAVLNGKHF